ncbi:MAG: pyridoxal phosphate-dependent decarboxylase family protein [Vicinamibacteria bacterium]
MDEIGSPATVASAGRRYFGFVTGGSVPASVAANWLASGWDQNGAFVVGSPVAAALEDVALGWIRSLLSLSDRWGCGFVTGTTMGNFSGLAAARHHVLARAGWDVEKDGLFGAPSVRVVVGAEAHTTLKKALALLGLGRDRVVTVPVDGRGRMRPDAFDSLPRFEGPSIVCLQAGNVDTGAFDPIREILPSARSTGAWVHVDGAFGLWAGVSPRTAHLLEGIDEVDSIASDLHKWLNVPYDNGLALYRDPESARAALSATAAYLPQTPRSDARSPCDYTPEASRRARGVDIWAALLSLGRKGVIDLVDRCCSHARRFASGLEEAGFEILNEVELNQVLVSFGDDETTRAVVDAIQRDGTCWCGGSFWHGRAAMRISVSSWATTDEDVERSLAAILRVAREVSRSS